MKLSRKTAQCIHFLLDAWIPPILRDSKWFMWVPFKLLFRGQSEHFFSFKAKAPFLSRNELVQIYRDTAKSHINRETDLTEGSISEIESHATGPRVLDIGCGRGLLSNRLARNYRVTGADFLIDEKLKQTYPRVDFRQTDIENLPFSDNDFDTVVSTHTLEHVVDLDKALFELRRVCAKQLMIVVPRQRPYEYTFDLHLHFFPYQWNVMVAFSGGQRNGKCYMAGGDWFYLETQ